MAKINWKPIKDFAGQLGGVVFYGLIAGVAYKTFEYKPTMSDIKPIGYGDAVEAIMKSGMWSSDKRIATATLKTSGTSDYYRAVVYVVSDDSTFSSDKITMIKELSEK